MSRVRCQESLLRSKTARGGHRVTDAVYNERWVARVTARCVVDANGCLLWQGFCHKWGYGMTSYRGKGARVHRGMWIARKGPVPPKMDVCHTCDVRHCCNLDHLWLGTRVQNLQDMANKGRGLCGKKAAQTHCIRNHPLSGDNIYYTNNGRRRHCRACDRYYQRMRMGWSAEEALNTPPYSQSAVTPRRFGRFAKRAAS